MSSTPEPRVGQRGGVIHDIGYAPYTGPRLDQGAIGRSLFTTGLLHAYGFGRSGKAKALPVTLLVLMVLPAAIIVAIMVAIGLDEGFIDYGSYPTTLMLLIVIFVAAQAPVLFSRDLRSGAIVLYLARPLSAAGYAIVRWSSLFVAILAFITVPLLVLYIGALAAEADPGEQTLDLLAALAGVVVLAAVLATVAGLVSAYTTRRGLAVGATIVALLLSTGVASAIQGIAQQADRDRIGQYAGLISPFTLTDGIQVALFDGNGTYPTPPEGAVMALVYVAVALLVVLGGIALIVQRYRRQASR